jgi:hypothetical protein
MAHAEMPGARDQGIPSPPNTTGHSAQRPGSSSPHNVVTFEAPAPLPGRRGQGDAFRYRSDHARGKAAEKARGATAPGVPLERGPIRVSSDETSDLVRPAVGLNPWGA